MCCFVLKNTNNPETGRPKLEAGKRKLSKDDDQFPFKKNSYNGKSILPRMPL
jgi:hypothetical protein